MALVHRYVEVPAAGVELEADIAVPDAATAMVLFAHGSGSGRYSPRNRFVAGELQVAGLATVLVDLLTSEEEQADIRTGKYRFDIDLLAHRVAVLIDWLAGHGPTRGLGIGLFGASTGAAAALVAAARRDQVQAVVSRGGRPDLADEFLRSVRQPTLLIVGERDPAVIDLNRVAMASLNRESNLEIVPNATHLFPEPGALEQVAHLARTWFLRHLRSA